MKQIYLVSDQKGWIKPYATFKEGKTAFDQMCSAHIKTMSDNPSFVYKRFPVDFDGQKGFQFVSHHKSLKNGKMFFSNDRFSFQTVTIDD